MTTAEQEVEYVTATVGDQLFGIPITHALDVFMPERITRVPLAPPAVAGVLNLRGRIVTALDMRLRLGLPPVSSAEKRMAIGIDSQGESFGLLVDAVGEVLKLPAAGREANPVNLDPAWVRVAVGVHRLEERLMVVLDVDRILQLETEQFAA